MWEICNSRNNRPEEFLKMTLLKFPKIPKKTPLVELELTEAADLLSCNFSKSELYHVSFLEKFPKF